MDNELSNSWFLKNDFTVEEAALLLVNVDPLDIGRIENLESINFKKWKAAMNYLSQMMMDIRVNKLQTTYHIVLNMNEDGKVIGEEMACDTNRHKPMAKNLTSIDLDNFYRWAMENKIPDVEYFQLRMPNEEKLISSWSEFAGKDTALMFIAGMAVALSDKSLNYKYGSKMNKSAIANAAIKAINDHGNGTTINPKSLTDLINQALGKYTPKFK